MRYHRVWKIRVTHIMIDRRTTIMIFIKCTDLHAEPYAASGRTNFVCLYEKILEQASSNSPQQCATVYVAVSALSNFNDK